MRWSILTCLILLLLSLPGLAQAEPQDSWAEHLGAQRTVTLDGQQVAYLDRGSGRVILMVHGVPTSSWLYRELVADLAGRGYRVVAPDLVGFGASSKTSDPQALSMGKQAEMLLALMDHLGIEQWTMMCHDMGGLVTWELLERAPERVERLVVLNTIAFAEGWDPPADLARQEVLKRVFRAMTRREKRALTLTRVLLTAGLVDASICRDERVVEGYFRPIAAGTDLAILAFMTSFEQVEADLPRYQATLRSLDIPAMIIWGEHDDILLADEQVARVAALLEVPFERVYVLGDGKHYIQEECSPQMCELVDGFMRMPLDLDAEPYLFNGEEGEGAE